VPARRLGRPTLRHLGYPSQQAKKQKKVFFGACYLLLNCNFIESLVFKFSRCNYALKDFENFVALHNGLTHVGRVL